MDLTKVFSSLLTQYRETGFGYLNYSPPYTFFLLNGDMEFYRDRHLFI